MSAENMEKVILSAILLNCRLLDYRKDKWYKNNKYKFFICYFYFILRAVRMKELNYGKNIIHND